MKIRFKRLHLFVIGAAFVLATIGWMLPGKSEVTLANPGDEEGKHCIGFTHSVTLEGIDPDNPEQVTAALRDMDASEERPGGCYDTAAEAVCAGTEGAICPPKDATSKDIDWAIRDYEYQVLGSNPHPGPWNWQPPELRAE